MWWLWNIRVNFYKKFLLCFILAYLVAILLDILKSRPPMALVIEDTNKGTIKHFSILKLNDFDQFYVVHLDKFFIIRTHLKKISPGKDMYIISRFVHSPVLFLMIKPTSPPTKTPITVAMVRTFSCMKALNLLSSCLGRVMAAVLWFYWG